MATPEAEEFAALLRELKDRSGRSYGVLAGKLHVSTSTLHRYCNGDAVPTEYAPVERLARLCAATPDELMELHRRWIVADSARRRIRAEGPVLETVPVALAEEVTPPVRPEADELASRTKSPKRLRIALAAGAVIALAVPTAVIANNAASPDEKEKSSAVAGAGTPSGTPASLSPSPSASPSVTPSAKPLPSVTTSATRPSGSRTSTAPAAAAEGVPLRVGISSYDWDEPCGAEYLLGQEPGTVPPPPAVQDRRGWARALGGVDGGHQLLQLTATGKTSDSVVLTAVHVRIVARNAPLAWNAYNVSLGCGSGFSPQTFDIDLDAGQPLVKPVAGRNGDTVVPAKDFPYKVASNDPQVLNIDLHTENHDVSWYLEVGWSTGDRRGTVRIDDGGKPFRTSAIEGRPMYDYMDEKGTWLVREY
ncbi:helix-turn-helix domain-containing protein [Streptomyces sp. NPDC052236]|uniref:helix-turn-helix domain-containing protein n=1 Tax=Streptomyces sp. NPDC052236 TaxID=3365686 RepID=UPI0037CF72F2